MTHGIQSTSHLMEITSRPEILFEKGSGSWLYDTEGTAYLDFVQGWAVNCLGHCPPEIQHALLQQSQTLLNCSPAYFNAPMLALAQLICETSGLDEVFFTNSGAEANEGAIKLARKWGSLHKAGAYEIITLVNGFHGRTLTTMAASGKPQWQDLFEPKSPGFKKIPINDPAALQDAISEKTVAVMLEPIQGEAGVIPCTVDYLQAVKTIADKNNLLLILDEIQTGIGRTGSLYAFQNLDITPDIMTLAKGLGGGVPLGALVANKSVSCFEHGDQGGTFNGNPLMAAVGQAVLETVSQQPFLDQVKETGAYLSNQLQALSDKLGQGSVRGAGLLLALELKAPIGASIVDAALAAGLLINAPRSTSLRFMPALNVSIAEIDHMLVILEKVMIEQFGSLAAA